MSEPEQNKESVEVEENLQEAMERLRTEESLAKVQGLIESVHSVEVKLSEQQANESSPLFSVSSFEELGLSEELLKGIYAMKYVKPSKVQEKALPLMLKSPPRNMIGQSQSGTGKTAAFVLTMLSRVDVTLKHPQAICVSPTRELARQIMDVVKQMGQFTQVTTAFALKESSFKEKIYAHVLVGTPGTLLDMQKRGTVDLSKIRVFVLDEADVMLDKQGMGAQSMRLKNVCPANCQTLLFSATFKPEVREFADQMVKNPDVITLKQEELSLDSIKQFYMDCTSHEHKLQILCAIYGLLTIGQSMIFVATKATAEQVQARMVQEGHATSFLHGGLEPAERDKVIDEFRSGITKVLICTNVLARGIDIQQVSLVVNFDVPLDQDHKPDFESYLHRIGRTGRFGRSGVSINFVHDKRSLEQMMQIQKFYGKEIIKVPTTDLEEIEKKLKDATK